MLWAMLIKYNSRSIIHIYFKLDIIKTLYNINVFITLHSHVCNTNVIAILDGELGIHRD